MATVVIVTGLPRTGAAYIGQALVACGAYSPPLVLNPVSGTTLWQLEDPTVWAYTLALLGPDGAFGIPKPTIPGALDSATVAAFQAYLAGQLAAAGSAPYVLVCHAAPMLIPTLLAAFPGATIKAVLATRSAANTNASIAAYAGVTTAQATSYTTAYTTALSTANTQLGAAGITPVQANWGNILAGNRSAFAAQITALGLTVPSNGDAILAGLASQFGS